MLGMSLSPHPCGDSSKKEKDNEVCGIQTKCGKDNAHYQSPLAAFFVCGGGGF
jgi:hypothetical protein